MGSALAENRTPFLFLFLRVENTMDSHQCSIARIAYDDVPKIYVNGVAASPVEFA